MSFQIKVPAGLQLRQAQIDALGKFNGSLLQRLAVSVPTGVGKTVIGLVQANSIEGRTLWLAHRDELITQPYETVRTRFPGLKAGIVKSTTDDYSEKLTIASVQTLARKDRLERIIRCGKPDLIVVDEVHHARAPTYKRILEACGAMEPRGPRVLGLTATAERSDRKSLFPIIEDLCYYLSLPRAIELKYLVPMIPILMPLAVDLSAMKKTPDGDFDEAQLDKEFERAQAAEGVAKAVYQHAFCDQTVVFTCSVNQAKRTADELRKYGIKAEAVWGEMASGRRRDILEALKKREIQAVCNNQLLTEGWDDPGVSCVVMARPTLSTLVWVQCVGRGLRLAPGLGKTSCKVIDMVDASNLGLVTADKISKTPGDLEEDGSWGSGSGGSGSSSPDTDFEIELVRRFLKRARQEPVCVRGTYFVEVKQGELWATVAKNSQPIYVRRDRGQTGRAGWVMEAEGQAKTDTMSQGDAMYAASLGIWEWGGPAVPGSPEWVGFSGLEQVKTPGQNVQVDQGDPVKMPESAPDSALTQATKST